MIIKHIQHVPIQPVVMDGADKASVRVIFGPNDGAPNFAMRQFELEPQGHTPFHNHPFEHEVIVMAGKLALVTDDGEIEINVGDAVMVLPNTRHQFRNLAEATSKFICMIPVEYQK